MLTPALATLAVVALWFLLFVVVHVFGLRSGRDNARWLVRSYAASSAGMLASVVSLSMWGGFGHSLLLSILLAALTSACLFVLYVPAVYTILTSLSVATLVLLRRSGGLPFVRPVGRRLGVTGAIVAGFAIMATGNLLSCALAHGLYDFLVLLFLLRGPGAPPRDEAEEEDVATGEPG